MNIWSPGSDEYDAYEAMADARLRYVIIEAPNPTSLADYVSSAMNHGMKPCGGPVLMNGVWHQAVMADDCDTTRRWMASERVKT